jgi:hypothetical protein
MAKKDEKTYKSIHELQMLSEFLVVRTSSGYRISKIINKKAVSLDLDLYGVDRFWIKPPAYIFKAKNSFFEFCEDENRWTRNKVIIENMVKSLKRTLVWELIENKNFFQVNENNKTLRSSKRKDIAMSLLEKIINN